MDAAEWIKRILESAAIVWPFVFAVVEGIKITFPDLPPRFKPVISVVVGEVLAILLSTQTDLTWQEGAAAGFIAGLVAAGLYSFGQARETAAKARR